MVSVLSVTMISNSGIFWTGEKKCMPMTRPGFRVASAIRAIGIVLVLEARIQDSETTASNSRNTCCFTSRSSKTASITRSARPRPAQSVPPDKSASMRRCSYRVMRLRLSRSRTIVRATRIPLLTRSRLVSRSRTSTPARNAAVPPIAAPMKPAPATTRFLIPFATGTGPPTPGSFRKAVSAKKI